MLIELDRLVSNRAAPRLDFRAFVLQLFSPFLWWGGDLRDATVTGGLKQSRHSPAYELTLTMSADASSVLCLQHDDREDVGSCTPLLNQPRKAAGSVLL